MTYLYFSIVYILRIYEILIFARVILSWIQVLEQNHPIVEFINRLTDPLILLSREIIFQVGEWVRVDVRTFPLDFSPMLSLLILELLRTLLGIILL